MSIFKTTPKKLLIFIVEDDLIYSNTLEQFLTSEFPDTTEIKTFPVGELCLRSLHLNPDFVILDHSLNSKYYDALEGFDVLKEIKKVNPETNVLLLSSQQDIDIVLRTIKEFKSDYVQKDDGAFEDIKEIISKTITNKSVVE